MFLNLLTKKDDLDFEALLKDLSFENFNLISSEKEFSEEKYVCISYAWGDQFIQHPYLENSKISERTLNVFTTAIGAYTKLINRFDNNLFVTNYYWLDSICIPVNQQDKDFQHSMMGEIYEKSSAVIVVFSKEMESVLKKIRNTNQLVEDDFVMLNNDEWVSRYWTYQEMVNAGKIFFVSEGSFDEPIFAADFFDKIANDIYDYNTVHRLRSIDFQIRFPFLSSLEAVILDWRIMDTQKRSVYQVMVNMEYRKSAIESSKIKAMFGCISNDLSNKDIIKSDDYETFLNLCSIKEDYSFIFNTSLNRHKTNQKWCPVAFDFSPIFPWLYCHGERQKGCVVDKILMLYDLVLKNVSNISDVTLNYLNDKFTKVAQPDKNSIRSLIESDLKNLNFTGYFNPIELDNGFYYNQFEVKATDNHVVAICTGVTLAVGAPAMLLEKSDQDDIYNFISSGVFFGKIDKSEIITHAIKID